MENLKSIKSALVSAVQGQVSDLKHTNTKELGEVIDMIKDVEEAMYYCAITKAMEESKEEKEHTQNNINYYMEGMSPAKYYSGSGTSYYSDQPRNSSGQFMPSNGSNNTRNYTPYMEYAPYMMRDKDWREGRSYYSRRMYMDSKQNSSNDVESMKELEHYIKDLGEDLTDMIKESSTEEKQMLSSKLQQLASKVNSTK